MNDHIPEEVAKCEGKKADNPLLDRKSTRLNSSH